MVSRAVCAQKKEWDAFLATVKPGEPASQVGAFRFSNEPAESQSYRSVANDGDHAHYRGVASQNAAHDQVGDGSETGSKSRKPWSRRPLKLITPRHSNGKTAGVKPAARMGSSTPDPDP